MTYFVIPEGAWSAAREGAREARPLGRKAAPRGWTGPPGPGAQAAHGEAETGAGEREVEGWKVGYAALVIEPPQVLHIPNVINLLKIPLSYKPPIIFVTDEFLCIFQGTHWTGEEWTAPHWKGETKTGARETRVWEIRTEESTDEVSLSHLVF